MRLLHALFSVIRAASESTVAVEEGPGSLALSRPVDTAGENIPRVDVEPGSRASDRLLSTPRGVASCDMVAAASDGGMLIATRNSTRFASFSSLRVRRSEGGPQLPLDDAVLILEPPLHRYA